MPPTAEDPFQVSEDKKALRPHDETFGFTEFLCGNEWGNDLFYWFTTYTPEKLIASFPSLTNPADFLVVVASIAFHTVGIETYCVAMAAVYIMFASSSETNAVASVSNESKDCSLASWR